MITTSKVACARSREGDCTGEAAYPNKPSRRMDYLFNAQSQLKLISTMIVEYDLEIAMSISHVDAVLTIPPPEGYLYISITPLEQLRLSLKRCACLLHHITNKNENEKDTIDHLWMSCLQGIIAYKSSWYKLFELLEDSQPSLHKMVAVFSRVRACLRITNEYVSQLHVHHEKLYHDEVLSVLDIPNDITVDIRNYLWG